MQWPEPPCNRVLGSRGTSGAGLWLCPVPGSHQPGCAGLPAARSPVPVGTRRGLAAPQLSPGRPSADAGQRRRLYVSLGCEQGHPDTFAFYQKIRPHPFPAVPQPPREFPGALRDRAACGLADAAGAAQGKTRGLGEKSESNPAGFQGKSEKSGPQIGIKPPSPTSSQVKFGATNRPGPVATTAVPSPAGTSPGRR